MLNQTQVNKNSLDQQSIITLDFRLFISNIVKTMTEKILIYRIHPQFTS
jgi:hypothetical protein